ncbi:SOS response-associated peptidase [Candidatus Poriferisodalis sp.]|uniref:SOS response-associated peptidase n=1 Tax=Candidatus Poriferisodalis sp. TaxID=3101277 RepID=UPI003B019720
MCGRFVSAASLEQIAAHFDTPLPGFDAPRSYNVAPTTDIVAVVGNDDARRIETFRWGLVPQWSKDPAKGPPLFNARSETAATKNSFRGAFKRRRCIVPADGFYEWPKAPKGTSRDDRPLPHYITRADGAMLAMAGLWERWSPRPAGDAGDGTGADAPTGPRQALHSATVLTTAANGFMAPIHDRMPVLLERSQWETWLDPANDDLDVLSAMCVPADEGTLRSRRVGREVGNVRNRDASLIEPVEADQLF